MNFSFRSKVVNGKLVSNRKPIQEAIATFEGKEIEISICKAKKKRSNPQNAFYWGVVVPIVRNGLIEIGYKLTNERTHDFLKERFLKEELVNEETGELLGSVSKSTASLTTTQFMEYMADINQFAAEFLGVTIPDPNEQLTITI